MSTPPASSSDQSTESQAGGVGSRSFDNVGWDRQVDRFWSAHLDPSDPFLPAVQTDETVHEQRSYGPLLRTGVIAALACSVLRLVIFFAAARAAGSRIILRRFLGIIPMPTVVADRAHFATLVSRSTLAATVVMVAVFAVQAFRRSSRDQIVWGWFMGVVGSSQMLLVDVIRHVLAPPVVLPKLVFWTLWPLFIGVAALVVVGKDRSSPPGNVKAASDHSQDSLTIP